MLMMDATEERIGPQGSLRRYARMIQTGDREWRAVLRDGRQVRVLRPDYIEYYAWQYDNTRLIAEEVEPNMLFPVYAMLVTRDNEQYRLEPKAIVASWTKPVHGDGLRVAYRVIRLGDQAIIPEHGGYVDIIKAIMFDRVGHDFYAEVFWQSLRRQQEAGGTGT